MVAQCAVRKLGSSSTVMASAPGLPRFSLTRCNAARKLLRSQTSSIKVSPNIGRSAGGFARGNSALAPGPCGFTPASQLKVPWWNLLPCSLPISSRSSSPLSTVWAFSEGWASPSMPAADFCGALRADSSPLSQFPWHATSQDLPQTSRGKLAYSRYTTAGFTLLALDGYGLCDLTLTRPAFTPSYPVPVRRLVSSLHASFRP